MCHLLGNHSDFALFGFSELHRAYLGLSGVTFEDILSSTTRSQIDRVDRTGRTTLSWACRRGDEDAVAQLLSCGADPNKADVTGRTPLHWSTASVDGKCMELLLAANADIDVKDVHGDTALSRSAYENYSDCLKILVAAGANIENENCQGLRPLHRAVQADNILIVSDLLRSAADINARTLDGNTAVLLAIQNNYNRSLRLLLARPEIDIQVVDNDGDNVLTTLASYGDEGTIQILRSAGLHGLNTSKRDKNDCTALEIAEWRCHFNERWSHKFLCSRDSDPIRWYNAFKAFIDELEARQQGRIDGSPSDWETISEQSTEKDSSDDEAAEDEEGWQDAHEYPETESLEP